MAGPLCRVATLLVLALGILSAADAALAASPGLKKIDEAALRESIDTLARDMMIPGVMVLLKTPQGELVHAYGTTQLGSVTPPRAETHFRIASNTKTMTSAAILLLAQEGRLRLDDPVSKYVAGVPNGDAITIALLLKMRSGLPSFTETPELAQSLDNDPARAWTAPELLALAVKNPVRFAPGAEYDYCNTNYLLLGMIAEQLEGKPLAAILNDRLFAPLGMKNTLLPDAASTAIPAPYAHGYMYGGSSYALIDLAYPTEFQAEARAGTIKPTDDTAQNPSYAKGAGGAISTARDLAVWMDALVDGKVFNVEMQKLWRDSPQPQDPTHPDGQKYGYGITLMSFGGNSVYFHGGEMPGYNSFMGRDPASGMTLVIWSNLTISLDGLPTANTIMLKILDSIYATSPLE